MLQQTWSGPPLPCLDSVRCKVVLTDGQHEVGYPTSASWPSGIDASRCNSSTSPMVHGSGEVMGAPHGTDYSFSGELEGVVVSAPSATSHPSWTGRWGDKVGRIRKRKKKGLGAGSTQGMRKNVHDNGLAQVYAVDCNVSHHSVQSIPAAQPSNVLGPQLSVQTQDSSVR